LPQAIERLKPTIQFLCINPKLVCQQKALKKKCGGFRDGAGKALAFSMSGWDSGCRRVVFSIILSDHHLAAAEALNDRPMEPQEPDGRDIL